MKIMYSPEAKEDLFAIKDSVEVWQNPELTKKVLKKITQTIRSLEVFPNMGVELSRTIGIPTEYRYIFCKQNYIFYRIEADCVRIVRILNEREDFMRVMFGIKEVEDEME